MRKTILDCLFSKTKQGILSTCLLSPDQWWTLSDMARKMSVTASSLQRDIKNLEEAEIFVKRTEQNRVYYKMNPSCPIIHELQAILIKTVGVRELLLSLLKKHLTKMEVAFIYGSMARGDIKAGSDIDLMIIGDVSLVEMASGIREAEKVLAREVNPTIYTKKEFLKKIKDSFIQTVIKDKKIFLKGDLSDFE